MKCTMASRLSDFYYLFFCWPNPAAHLATSNIFKAMDNHHTSQGQHNMTHPIAWYISLMYSIKITHVYENKQSQSVEQHSVFTSKKQKGYLPFSSQSLYYLLASWNCLFYSLLKEFYMFLSIVRSWAYLYMLQLTLQIIHIKTVQEGSVENSMPRRLGVSNYFLLLA